MIGGAYLTTDTTKDKCDGSQLCFPDVKAPIEQKPRITHVNAVPLTQYQMQMEAFADTPFELTITARDPNLNDHIQIDFTPFDVGTCVRLCIWSSDANNYFSLLIIITIACYNNEGITEHYTKSIECET